MTPHERPRLRPGLAAARDAAEPNHYVLWDNRRITHRMVRMSAHELAWVQLFNGRNGLRDLQLMAMNQNGGQIIAIEHFTALTARLDEALLLDSPRFREYLSGPVREPSCLGCYDADPEKLRRQMADIFTAEGGPGLPAGAPPAEGSMRGLLAPHMDYTRGGITYGWGYHELFRHNSARLFVIIGTAHYSPARFTLTRQNYQTPLGAVETDQSYVDRIVERYGEGLFDDPVAHFPEHSIELELVPLQFLYERFGPIRIVPLLVGSFHDAVLDSKSPSEWHDIARMVQALRQAESGAGEEVCYIISGDLAHIGPKFDDPEPVHDAQLGHSRVQDEQLMQHAQRMDLNGYFDVIAREGDARRICGLPPTWTALMAARPSQGRLLHYDQYVHPDGFESVSFASMAFDK